VTGSYIPTAETESALPVTVYTAEVLQKQGAQTPVEGLRQLPSFVGNAVTENDSNGGNGQATINLRAIGAQNTLVLINGRRAYLGIAANAGTIGGGADINAIPLGATARTEVLKDGASAIYGSDAVGGVVNFVLLNGPGENPYEGAEINILYGNTTESDEHVRQAYIRGGVKTDKVAIAAAGEYYSKANLFSRDRAKLAGSGDLRSTAIAGQMGLNPPGIGPLGRGGLNNNSPTFAGRINVAPSQAPIDANGNPVIIDLPPGFVNAVPAPLPPQGGALVQSDLFLVSPDDADYRRFDVPGGSDPARFNFRAFTPARPAIEKAMYYVTGRYNIFGESMRIYGDIMYSATRQDNGLAPSPFSIPLGGYVNAAVVVPYIDPRTGLPFGPIAPPPPGAPSVSFGQFSGAAQRAIIQNSVFNPIAGRDVFRPADPAAGPFTGNILVFPNPNAGQRARRLARYISPPGTLTNLAYRLVQELGNRRTLFDHDYYRYVAGINGDLNFQGNNFISRFGYDTGLVYEQFDERRTDSGDARRGTIYNEIIAGNFNPFIGQNAPAVGTAMTYVNGVPTGIMAPYDNVAATQRAAFIARSFLYERDWIYDAKVNAHFFPNMYNGGFDMAAGYEHREHREQSIPDPTQGAGDQLGFNAADDYSLKTLTNSVFFELTFPIVTSTMNIPFVRSLELSAAWRYEKFELRDQYTHNTAEFDNSNPDEDFGGTPRLSLRYQPIADLTLRANFNQSFRAPTAFGLFSPLQQNFPAVFDPFDPRGGLTLQPPNGVFQGGNLNLTPEKTDSYSAGIVYTPKWLPGFTVTADYYQLYTTDVLLGAADAAQVLLSLNFPDPDDPQGGGNGVTRNADGTLAGIDSAVSNAGKRFVQGMDVTAVYEIPTQNIGTFTFSLGWNHFFTYKAEPLPGFGFHNFIGDFSATFPLTPGAVPFNKGFVRGEWNWKGLTFNATLNYIGDFEDDPNFITGNEETAETTLANPAFVLHHRVSDYETLDMNLSYEFIKPQMEPAAGGYSKDAKDGKNAMSQVAGVENNGSFLQRMLWGTRITVGVNNVFDRYPPTVLGAFNDNYDTSLYNIRNRYYYIALNKKF
jgi:outer membrane receptor protein involved in Fe transport